MAFSKTNIFRNDKMLRKHEDLTVDGKLNANEIYKIEVVIYGSMVPKTSSKKFANR